MPEQAGALGRGHGETANPGWRGTGLKDPDENSCDGRIQSDLSGRQTVVRILS